MTRRLAIAALIVVASPAVADTPKPAAIEALVKANLDAMAADEPALGKLQLGKDHVLAAYQGEVDEKQLGEQSYNLSMLYRGPYGDTKHKLGSAWVSTADGVAWFSLPYHMTSRVGTERDENDQRVAGVAVPAPDGKGWELYAVHYARILPDKELMKVDTVRNLGSDRPGATAIHGDKDLAAVVQGWLAKGFSGHATTLASPIATGTSSAEAATGAKDVQKLTAGWDGLHLIATDLTAHLNKSGKVGFVTATVQFPRPKGQKGNPVRMGMTVVLVKEGSEWKWAALTFSA